MQLLAMSAPLIGGRLLLVSQQPSLESNVRALMARFDGQQTILY